MNKTVENEEINMIYLINEARIGKFDFVLYCSDEEGKIGQSQKWKDWILVNAKLE